MKKLWVIPVVMVLVFCLAASKTTRVMSYTTLHTNVDVSLAPDTTLIGNADGFARGTVSTAVVDLLKLAGAGRDSYASKVSLIFSHAATSDADASTSVFELHGSADSGPRELICTLALTGGKGRVTSGSDLVTWVDTAVATNYRGVSNHVRVDDSAGDRPVRVIVPIEGLRYLEGLFTGAGSTASEAIAYIRPFSE